MASRRKSRGKRINPTFYVFCEGPTEEEYVRYLKRKYRVPIHINSKVAGDSISSKYIKRYLKTKNTHPKDRVFFMYDLDKEGVLERLHQMDGMLLVSNPCLELWFLLHYQDQRANISTKNCIRSLRDIWPEYQKGKLSDNLKEALNDSLSDAVYRAKQLERYLNPSTTIHDFIAELEGVKEGGG